MAVIYHSVSFPIPSPISLKQVKASLTVENFADRHGSLYVFYTVLYSAKSQGLAGNPKAKKTIKKLLKSNEKTIPVILVIL